MSTGEVGVGLRAGSLCSSTAAGRHHTSAISQKTDGPSGERSQDAVLKRREKAGSLNALVPILCGANLVSSRTTRVISTIPDSSVRVEAVHAAGLDALAPVHAVNTDGGDIPLVAHLPDDTCADASAESASSKAEI